MKDIITRIKSGQFQTVEQVFAFVQKNYIETNKGGLKDFWECGKKKAKACLGINFLI